MGKRPLISLLINDRWCSISSVAVVMTVECGNDLQQVWVRLFDTIVGLHLFVFVYCNIVASPLMYGFGKGGRGVDLPEFVADKNTNTTCSHNVVVTLCRAKKIKQDSRAPGMVGWSAVCAKDTYANQFSLGAYQL